MVFFNICGIFQYIFQFCNIILQFLILYSLRFMFSLVQPLFVAFSQYAGLFTIIYFICGFVNLFSFYIIHCISNTFFFFFFIYAVYLHLFLLDLFCGFTIFCDTSIGNYNYQLYTFLAYILYASRVIKQFSIFSTILTITTSSLHTVQHLPLSPLFLYYVHSSLLPYYSILLI